MLYKKIFLFVAATLLFLVPVLLDKRSLAEAELGVQTCEWNVNVEGLELPLERYVIGVVSAEMPAEFDLEALKAQAIAARTYALYKMQEQQTLVATTAHQVFYNDDNRKSRWHDKFEHYEAKVTQAVEQTAGQVLTFHGAIVSAMFHAASNGQTESAYNYSGNDIPYLRAVTSPESDLKSETIQSDIWTSNELLQAVLKRNTSGRVQQASIAGKVYSGREVRDQLQLASRRYDRGRRRGSTRKSTRHGRFE